MVHSYNRRNLYQQIGNFFIAVGPLLFGPALIVLLAWMLIPEIIPDTAAVFTVLKSGFFVPMGYKIFVQLVQALGQGAWPAWLCTGLSLAVAAHMELSRWDLKGIGPGIVAGLVLLLLLNFVAILFPVPGTFLLTLLNELSVGWAGTLQFATILSAGLFLICWILLLPVYGLRTRRLLLPW